MSDDLKEQIAEIVDQVAEAQIPEEEVLEEEPQEEPQEKVSGEAEQPEDIEEQPVQEAAEEPQEDLVAPEAWPNESKEAFNSLPREAQQTLLDQSKNLERGYTKKFQEIAEIKREHEAIASLFQPLEGQMRAANVNREGAIRGLLEAQSLLNSNPLQGLRQLVSTYGRDGAAQIVQSLAQEYGVLAPAEGQAEEEYIAPEVVELRNQVNGLTQKIEQQNQQTIQQQQDAIQKQISDFANKTDDAGNLLHPHFEKVRGTMGSLITASEAAGQSMTLEQAYTKAVRSEDDLFEEILTKEKESFSKKKEVERKTQVASSKKASRNPKTRNVAPQQADKPKTVREAAAAAYAESMS